MGIRAFRAVAFWGLVLLAALVGLGVYQLPQEWRVWAVVWLMVGLPLVLVLARIWIAWAKTEEARATLTNGVLQITLPKVSVLTRKRIAID